MERFGKTLLAIATAGLALFDLAYGRFAPEATLPGWLPFQAAFINGVALLILASSAGLFFARTTTASVLLIAGYETLWSALTLSSAVTAPLSFGAWYPACEALSALAGPCILYLVLRGPAAGTGHALRAARMVFALGCIFYGASHFAYADYTAAMVPGWLPPRLEIAYFTGACHIAAGIGIIAGLWWAALLETLMMSLFGLLVWLPSFFADPIPKWATPPQAQWSEVAINLALVASAWWVTASLKRPPSR